MIGNVPSISLNVKNANYERHKRNQRDQQIHRQSTNALVTRPDSLHTAPDHALLFSITPNTLWMVLITSNYLHSGGWTSFLHYTSYLDYFNDNRQFIDFFSFFSVSLNLVSFSFSFSDNAGHFSLNNRQDDPREGWVYTGM